MRLRPVHALLFLVLAMVLAAPGAGSIVPTAHSLSVDKSSSVFISPVGTCCAAAKSQVTVDVMMNLTTGEIMNGFDVSLNYSTPYDPFSIVRAVSLDYSNNVFPSSQVTTVASCIDGIYYGPDGFCTADDTYVGRVHVTQSLLGQTISGPLTNKRLFSVTFNVTGIGTSIFTFHAANLVDPGQGSLPDPHFIPLVTQAGIFGNNGLVAFFNYEPSIPPSLLPAQPVIFDASISYISTSTAASTIASPVYQWDFGDGHILSGSQARVTHVYGQPGDYTVMLTVSNSTYSGRIERSITVLPALGGMELRVRNLKGSPPSAPVQVMIHNASATLPACSTGCNITADSSGTAEFRGLLPGYYLVSFSGSSIHDYSEDVLVNPGWTTQKFIYLTEISPSPPPFPFVEALFGGVVGGAIVALGVLILVRRNRGSKGKRMKVAAAKRIRKG